MSHRVKLYCLNSKSSKCNLTLCVTRLANGTARLPSSNKYQDFNKQTKGRVNCWPKPEAARSQVEGMECCNSDFIFYLIYFKCQGVQKVAVPFQAVSFLSQRRHVAKLH